MSLVNQDGKLLLTNGVLASGVDCCCHAACACEQCFIDVQVNGVSVPYNLAIAGEQNCDATCPKFFLSSESGPIGTICEGEGVDGGQCDEAGGFTGPILCSTSALACSIVECSQSTLTIRVYFGTQSGGPCEPPIALGWAGRTWYSDYEVTLPPCDSASEAQLISTTDFNYAGECDGNVGDQHDCCPNPPVTVTCNAFP